MLEVFAEDNVYTSKFWVRGISFRNLKVGEVSPMDNVLAMVDAEVIDLHKQKHPNSLPFKLTTDKLKFIGYVPGELCEIFQKACYGHPGRVWSVKHDDTTQKIIGIEVEFEGSQFLPKQAKVG